MPFRSGLTTADTTAVPKTSSIALAFLTAAPPVLTVQYLTSMFHNPSPIHISKYVLLSILGTTATLRQTHTTNPVMLASYLL